MTTVMGAVRDLFVAELEYEIRFLALERFAPGSFYTERERVVRFVSGLRLSLKAVVSMFARATLEETVMKAIEGEST